MRFDRLSLLLAPFALAACATSPALRTAPAAEEQVFGEKRAHRVETLVVLLDGDGTASGAASLPAFAEAAARVIPAGAVLAIEDEGMGDDFSQARIARIGDRIAARHARFPRARLVVVGISGGAVLAANLAGMRPQLMDGMVLVGCPCALPEWRAYRRKQSGADPLAATAPGLDPLKTAGGIVQSLRAAVLVGADDRVTPIRFSRAYAEALTLRGVATDYRIVPGKGHDLLNDPEVLAATQRLAAALPRKK